MVTKNDVLDYVMTSPYNANRQVLSSILDSYVSGDNKEEVELTATENKVYTPDEGKVYKKVTVNVPTGGSTNLELVEVTITSEGMGNFYQIYMPHYDSQGNFKGAVMLAGPGTQTISVPIDPTKGLSAVMCDIPLATTVTVTGGVTYTAGEFGVTAAGTITI